MRKLILLAAVALLFSACSRRTSLLPQTAMIQFRDKSLVQIPNQEFNFKVGALVTVYKEDGKFEVPVYRGLPGAPLKDTIIQVGGHTIWHFAGKVIATNN